MHSFRLTVLLLIIALCSFGQQNKRPNIIFIFSDDHTYQAVSAYGSKLVTTPNIDRIAREGTIFRNAMVTNSICGPSRAVLLTGKYSHLNGYKGNEGKFDVSQQLFPQLLQANGYQTAWVGKWHLGSLPRGFDYWNILPDQGHYYNPLFIGMNNDTVRSEGYVTNLITEFSTNWLDRRDTSKPFFMVVGEKATHREWLPDIQDLGAYDSVEFPLPPNFFDNYDGRTAAKDQDMSIGKTMRLDFDLKVHADYDHDSPYQRFTSEQKRAFADYYENHVSKEFDEKKLTGRELTIWKYQRYMRDYLSVARSLDRNIGKLLDYLDQKGLTGNTVVIYASDQGFYLGEHGWFDKRFMYEQSLRTPFILKYPKKARAGTSVNQLVSNIDWAPTVLDIAGVKIPASMQGRSVMPLVAGKPGNWRKEIYYHYYEYPQPHAVYPHFGIRSGKYKLIRFYGPKNFWELYDLEKDGEEMKNIYGSAGVEKITNTLKRKLRELIVQYRDDEALKIFSQIDTAGYFSSFDGTKIYFERAGSGKPVLLIHGFTGKGDDWKRMPLYQDLLANGYSPITVDMRGGGKSDKPHNADAYAKDAEAKDLMILMKKLGVERYSAVGYSRGSIIAARLLVLDPNIEKAVLGGMGAEFTNPQWPRRIAIYEALMNDSIPGFEAFHKRIAQNKLDQLALAYQQKEQPSTSREALGKIKQPVLVVCGDRDKDNGDGRELSQLIPGSSFREVPGDHGSAMSSAEFATETLLFLDKKTSRNASVK